MPPASKEHEQSYRVDETYIEVKGKDRYLYRAVDSTGNPSPKVVNVDKNPAYPAAVKALKVEGTLPRRVRLRQCKYLNNIVE